MKGHSSRRRTRNRRSRGGFTLIELMVVVVLISIVAALAAPSMSAARSDQLAFSYARQASQMVHNARSRASGRGAAQLVIFTNASPFGAPGGIIVYEALDGTPSTVTAPALPGPNPVSSCRGAGQWAYAATAGLGADPARRAGLIEALNLQGTAQSLNTVEGMQMVARVRDTSGTPINTPAFALCVTPNGTTYFSGGANVSDAIRDMQASTPFTGEAELEITRNSGGNPVGLKRKVVLTGAAAPRLRSE